MIAPPPASAMAGAIAAVRKNGAFTFTRVDAVEGLLVGGRGAATGIDARRC